MVLGSDGRSPDFWTRGLAPGGLAGTRGLASPMLFESRDPELSNKSNIAKIRPLELEISIVILSPHHWE